MGIRDGLALMTNYLQGGSTLNVEENSSCSTVEVTTPETDAIVEA